MKGFPSAGPKTRRCWWGERSDEVLQKCAIRRKNPRGLFSPSLTSKDGWKRLTTDRVGQAVVEPGLGAVCLYHMIWTPAVSGFPRRSLSPGRSFIIENSFRDLSRHRIDFCYFSVIRNVQTGKVLLEYSSVGSPMSGKAEGSPQN